MTRIIPSNTTARVPMTQDRMRVELEEEEEAEAEEEGTAHCPSSSCRPYPSAHAVHADARLSEHRVQFAAQLLRRAPREHTCSCIVDAPTSVAGSVVGRVGQPPSASVTAPPVSPSKRISTCTMPCVNSKPEVPGMVADTSVQVSSTWPTRGMTWNRAPATCSSREVVLAAASVKSSCAHASLAMRVRFTVTE